MDNKTKNLGLILTGADESEKTFQQFRLELSGNTGSSNMEIIDEALGELLSKDNIFIAEKDATTFSDIKQAYEDKKSIYLKTDSEVCAGNLAYMNGEQCIFITYISNSSDINIYQCSDSGWTSYVQKYLPMSGGTMTGDLILNGAPQQDNSAAPKSYVDTAITTYDTQIKGYIAEFIGGVEEVLTEADALLGGD